LFQNTFFRSKKLILEIIFQKFYYRNYVMKILKYFF